MPQNLFLGTVQSIVYPITRIAEACLRDSPVEMYSIYLRLVSNRRR